MSLLAAFLKFTTFDPFACVYVRVNTEIFISVYIPTTTSALHTNEVKQGLWFMPSNYMRSKARTGSGNAIRLQRWCTTEARILKILICHNCFPRVNEESAVNFGMFFQLEISLERPEQPPTPESPYLLILFLVFLSAHFFQLRSY